MQAIRKQINHEFKLGKKNKYKNWNVVIKNPKLKYALGTSVPQPLCGIIVIITFFDGTLASPN